MVKPYQYKRNPHRPVNFDTKDGWLVFDYDGRKYQTDLEEFEQKSFLRFIKPLRLDEILKYALLQKRAKKIDKVGVKIDKTNKRVVFEFLNHKSFGIDV
jgi:hypothetical protein